MALLYFPTSHWLHAAAVSVSLKDPGAHGARCNSLPSPAQGRYGVIMDLLAQQVHTSLLEASDPRQKARLDATTGPASGLWLSQGPNSCALALPSWAFRIAFRCRLGLPLFTAGATCCLKAAGADEACGKVLDQDGVHSTTCKCGGFVQQFHDCVKDVVWQACKAAGHFAHKEQVVPQWGRWMRKRRRRADPGDGPEWWYEEAILDVVSLDPSTLQHRYSDATVRNSMGQRYLEAGSAERPGLALRMAAE